VLRSFAQQIFSHTAALRTQEYFVSFKDEKQGVGKKMRAKPNPFLWNAAHAGVFVWHFSFSAFSLRRRWHLREQMPDEVETGGHLISLVSLGSFPSRGSLFSAP